jgi:hypothetical protein
MLHYFNLGQDPSQFFLFGSGKIFRIWIRNTGLLYGTILTEIDMYNGLDSKLTRARLLP